MYLYLCRCQWPFGLAIKNDNCQDIESNKTFVYFQKIFFLQIYQILVIYGSHHVIKGFNQPSCQTCLTCNLSNKVLQKFDAFVNSKALKKTYRPRKVLHLVVVAAAGLASHFVLFAFECFYCYVWILHFLRIGSNTTDEKLFHEMWK